VWNAVKCSGTSGPGCSAIHRVSASISSSESLCPGISSVVSSNHTSVSPCRYSSVSYDVEVAGAYPVVEVLRERLEVNVRSVHMRVEITARLGVPDIIRVPHDADGFEVPAYRREEHAPHAQDADAVLEAFSTWTGSAHVIVAYNGAEQDFPVLDDALAATEPPSWPRRSPRAGRRTSGRAVPGGQGHAIRSARATRSAIPNPLAQTESTKVVFPLDTNIPGLTEKEARGHLRPPIDDRDGRGVLTTEQLTDLAARKGG
jgi:hypothetical protein